MPARLRLPVLLALFCLSGACALTYQVLWLRQLSLVFGVTVYAASTVLAAFMAGLALGSLLAPRVLARTGAPLVAFAVAEVLIGVLALATPLVFEAAGALYAAVHRAAPDSFALLTFARFVCSFVVLLPPTALMGMTLPLLVASPMVHGSAFGSRVSALYAVNTAGAVAGCLLTGFILIGGIGMRATFITAAAINIGVGLLAWALSRADRQAFVPSPANDLDLRNDGVTADAGGLSTPGPIAGLLALSGFASLALEIVWFRALVQFLPATTYAFTTMLATVLGGIALGGALAARVLAVGRRDLVLWIGAAQLFTGVAAAASMWFLAWSYAAGWRTSAPVQGSIVAILPATVLMGLTFPLALRAGVGAVPGRSARQLVTERVGRFYAANVLGAIAGSLAGGFLIVPSFGVRRGLLALAALYVVSGVMVLLLRPRPRRLVLAGASAALFALVATRVPDPFVAALERRHGDGLRELWRDEGAQTAVSVHGSRLQRVLFLDGLHQANDNPDMVRLHRSIGHLPMVLHPDPRSVLVVGLGGGATPGAVTQYPGVQVHVVELSEGVRQAARFFAHVNYEVLRQPNVALRVDDGRNFLQLTDERFDVITADIIQPIHAGAGSLYSRDYFELVRRALKPGGVALQWIGHRPRAHYELMLRTFASVFPHATLWQDGTLMIGTLEPLRLSRAGLERRLQDPRTRDALALIGLTSFEALSAWYTAGPAEIRRFVGDGPVLTDDQPRVEYHRSLPADEPVDLSRLRGDVATLVDP